MIDLNELKARVLDAGSDTWHLSKYGGVWDSTGNFEIVPAEINTENKAFIAAAHPAVVLELIDLVERQEAELAAARASLPAAGAVLTNDQREAVIEALAGALGDAYDCTRVWSAWSYGTMGPDDFSTISQDDARLSEIAEAVIAAMLAVQPAPSAALIPAQQVLTPNWAGEFASYQHWVNKAQSWLKSPSHRPAMCVDAKGRRCAIGADMMRARDEDAFPVRYFWDCEPHPSTAPAQAAAPDTRITEQVKSWRAEIARLTDLIAHATGAAAPDAQPDLEGAIMNIQCRRADDRFLSTASRLLYKEGHRDARHDAASLVAAHFAAAQPEAKAAPDDAKLPTDLSHRLRAKACQPFGPEDFALLTQAADEIERYYGGMVNWKANAQYKDSQMADYRERIAVLQSAAPAPATLNNEQIVAIWNKANTPSIENGWTTGPLPFAHALLAAAGNSQDAKDAAPSAPVGGSQHE